MVMKKGSLIIAVAAANFLAAAVSAQQGDAAGCRDHQLFPTRMPNYRIETCKSQDFGMYDFAVGKPPKTKVEGKYTEITYAFTGQRQSEPSGLEIIRNYENAAKKVGGAVVFSDPVRLLTAKFVKNDNEAWVEVVKGNGKIWLKIVEKAGMTQRIEANAEIFGSDIRSTGHASVYGILFDIDSDVLKSESGQAIGEIAKLLKADATLKIHVVGHTDNTGSADHNLLLSQKRAQAVMQELVQKQGIAADRLKSFGCGQYAPVASNDSEEGRVKNRRVELVKQ
jgi:OmpA-OmpF porin, OOP family